MFSNILLVTLRRTADWSRLIYVACDRKLVNPWSNFDGACWEARTYTRTRVRADRKPETSRMDKAASIALSLKRLEFPYVLVDRFLNNFCDISTYTVFARLGRWVTERRSDTGGKRRKEKELRARAGQRCRNEEIIAAPTVATGKCRSRNDRPEYTCSGYFRFEPIAQLSQLDKHARAPLRTAVIRRRRAYTYKCVLRLASAS